jgi:tRNA threonylcarbamoyladenosine biosynthesis protein TsaE
MEYLSARNLEDLDFISRKIIEIIGDNRIVAFYGKMGAGKTTLIKSICKNLTYKDVVTSPTFTLVNEYRTEKGEIIYHFDFYRVRKLEEIYDFGYEDYFFSGNYCFIEWPEIAQGLLPAGTINVKIEELSDHSRQISIE